ncbi:MAG: HAD-IC family P-type ATPase [Actinomycetia bacterium]|nr:HAD-IC family P-type ATPase [Actinomycetes bacterium]MCP4960834.1 HAD-IC family P-type ATPase [Actinomycetes bacterium]
MSSAGPDISTGLSSDQVAERRRDGRINAVPASPSRTIGQIIRANIFTTVNLIIGTLLVLILVAGKPGDALFAGVIISNSVIGIIQEVRAKQTLDQLALLNAPVARVRRDATEHDISVEEVVADDLLVVGPGDQVVVDGTVLETIGLDMDESLLTGESDAVTKTAGDEVLSGSFVASGSGVFRATRIGSGSYASSLAEEAKRFTLVNSELRNGISMILKWLTLIIPPVSILLLWRLLDAEPEWQLALQGTVAAAVAMVPDGLVLLTSITFIVGILALAKRQALAKELASVELLARVDILCLDKTGTITTGEIAYSDLDLLEGPGSEIESALASLAAVDPNPNPTLAAIATAHAAAPTWESTAVVPFSSARKWAAAQFDGWGAWYLGAPEMVAPGAEAERLATHTARGRRVVLLASSPSAIDTAEPALPADVTPRALVLLEDEVRPDAPEIFRFLIEQGIGLRVISGDHPSTVAAVAARAGIPDATSGFDARSLPEDESELANILATSAVFGRVTPHQKRAMVRALQNQGHVVAMTGDGVNDVLALKDADMGIAMGSGSAASRAVAQLTLLDNRFSTLPLVLSEGRKVINNIERVATLFVAKATYAVLLALATGAIGSPFPFLPRHLTLIGTFSIGVPGFFLALAPNDTRARSGFIRRIVSVALPTGSIAAAVTFVAYEIIRRGDATLPEARTAATVVLLTVGLAILSAAARPINKRRAILIASMAAAYTVISAIPPMREFFELDAPPTIHWVTMAVASGIGASLVWVIASRIDPRPSIVRRQ